MSPSVSTATSTATRAVAVDTGARSLADVEHLAHGLDRALHVVFGADQDAYVLSSHVARTPIARHVAVITWPSSPATDPDTVTAAVLDQFAGLALVEGTLVAEPALAPGARDAAAEALSRRTGRLMRYPGRSSVESVTTAARAVAESCVDAVRGLAGVLVEPDTTLDLTGFARPTWQDGRAVLLVQQGRQGLIPFEVRDQVPCCSTH
ncbi:hypothetical protein [Nocardioides insulae]|uniref:hypothetical protein n=1 Tax=Nocardioides insulae TaxID=394734 RepID=UPI000402C79B|nr:hypothetical protein [Nocardioides insulae]